MKLFGTNIKKIVSKSVGSGLPKVTLTSVINNTRVAGKLTQGLQPSETQYVGRGVVSKYSDQHVASTSVLASDRKILLIWGSFPEGSPKPKPGDKITAEAVTYRIVSNGVSRDPAEATFTCQCRK